MEIIITQVAGKLNLNLFFGGGYPFSVAGGLGADSLYSPAAAAPPPLPGSNFGVFLNGGYGTPQLGLL
jgi:hypothetical protein